MYQLLRAQCGVIVPRWFRTSLPLSPLRHRVHFAFHHLSNPVGARGAPEGTELDLAVHAEWLWQRIWVVFHRDRLEEGVLPGLCNHTLGPPWRYGVQGRFVLMRMFREKAHQCLESTPQSVGCTPEFTCSSLTLRLQLGRSNTDRARLLFSGPSCLFIQRYLCEGLCEQVREAI